MKKTLLLTAIAAMSLGSAALSPALAAPISAPPQISESAAEDARDQVQAPRRASNYEKLSEKARQYEVNPDLAPTDADYAKARKDREEGKIERRSQRTEIEAIRDQNNRITEYVVTPGSTEIPYSIQNRSDRPNNNPGHSKDTLGTPKFINFGF